jgi:hypothetical protein
MRRAAQERRSNLTWTGAFAIRRPSQVRRKASAANMTATLESQFEADELTGTTTSETKPAENEVAECKTAGYFLGVRWLW